MFNVLILQKSSLEMQNHIQAKHIDKTTKETRPGEEGLLAKPNKVACLLLLTSWIPVFDLMGFQNRICWTHPLNLTACKYNFPFLAHILDPRETWCFSAVTLDIAARRPIANWIAGHMCRFRWNFIIALHTYFTFKLHYS